MAAHGEGKRPAFTDVLDAYDSLPRTRSGGERDGPPIARVAPAGDLVWLVDRALSQGIADDDADGEG